jgi:aldose 1-epimerase
MKRRSLFGLVAMLALSACGQQSGAGPETSAAVSVQSAPFETLVDGRQVTVWTLRNSQGAGLTIMDLGATILTLDVPDRAGQLGDVVFGFDRAAPYLSSTSYFGAVVGRFANRIARGRFSLGGQSYTLAINNPPNTLHGGDVGFDKRVWRGEEVNTADGHGVRFTLTSPDGEEGYPGEVVASVTYVWTEANALIVDYSATSSEPTPFNISQHTYWNLAGANAATVLDHELRIAADAYTPVDATLIPTGEIAPVALTPFDFRVAKPIGRDIGADDAQLRFGQGYDHNWALNGSGFREAAWLHDPSSGRTMTISTDQPGLQFYSGNFLDGSIVGKGGNAYPLRSAIVLETQHFPDSPNQPNFPSAVLSPDQPFASRTIFQFGVDQ